MSRIYVDIDDVLCRTTQQLVQLVHSHFGKRVAFESLRSFDLSQSFGLSEAQHHTLLELAHQPETISSYAPRDGARTTLERWVERGYTLVLCTGRPPDTERATRAWLDRNAMPHDELHFIDKYARHDGPSLETLEVERFCLAIEDSHTTASFLSSRGIPVVLMDRPWNRVSTGEDEPFVRCDGWDEVVTRFPQP